MLSAGQLAVPPDNPQRFFDNPNALDEWRTTIA